MLCGGPGCGLRIENGPDRPGTIAELYEGQDLLDVLVGKLNDKVWCAQAAEILNYHPDHLGRLLRDGRVVGEQVGGRWMITHQEVERIKSMQGPGGRLPKTTRRQRIEREHSDSVE